MVEQVVEDVKVKHSKNLLDRFNTFFGEEARAVITDNGLEITVGSQTLVISLPEVIGGYAKGSS